MTMRKTTLVLGGLVFVLALVAAGLGVFWPGSGDHFTFQSVHGEAVAMQGYGLYRLDSVSGAAQEISQDVVTLLIGLPLLAISLFLAGKGALRGQLLLAGTLGYFLYTYAAMSFLTTYNVLFLVYVALFALSLFAFILALLAIPVAELPAHFSNGLPRRTIAGFCLFLGGMLSLLWLGRIVPSLVQGTPPFGLENYTTLVIQALDLGVIVPTALLTGVLLLRRVPVGYLLGAVVLIKGFSLGAALTAMTVGQILAGVAISPVEALIFPAIALADATLVVLLLRSLTETRPWRSDAPPARHALTAP